MPKTRNIIIFIAIAAIFVLAYVFLVKPSSDSSAPNLVSTSGTTTGTDTSGTDASSSNGTSVAQSFLNLLLGVKTIKLDVSIFSNPAFTGLHDSSITLVPDTTVGRPNPFAQFDASDVSSSDATAAADNSPTITTPITTTTVPDISATPTDSTASAIPATSTKATKTTKATKATKKP